MPASQHHVSSIRRSISYFFQGAVCLIVLAACSSVPPAPAPVVQGGAKVPSTPTANTNRSALPPAGSGRGAYYQDDGPGEREPEGLLALPDAEPRVEPYAKTGNRPYVVFGKRYTPFLDDRPFRERGRGSWYGKKFHGQRTSSGEPYDMYKMTAAHPTLPIPSYARVTNVANGRQVIVRVNDRGPFHSSRIMDLSYTAALKLGYLQQGSAELEVERLLPADIEQLASKPSLPPSASPAAAQAVAIESVAKPEVAVIAVPVASVVSASQPNNAAATPALGGFYLQLGAYSQADGAEAARSQLQKQWEGLLPPIEVMPGGAIFRLFSGPFVSRVEAANVAQKLQDAGAVKPMIVQR